MVTIAWRLTFCQSTDCKDPVGSDRTDFGFRVLGTQELPWQLNMDINAGLVAVGQPHG
jgi:hypothetical protein